MILVDTSIWIDHLHHNDGALVELLERNEVIVHPMVVAELALGSLANRDHVLALLMDMPPAPRASDAEVITYIEADSLWSRGLSVVDVHLLAAVRLMPGTQLWTRDKRLRAAAKALGLAWGR